MFSALNADLQRLNVASDVKLRRITAAEANKPLLEGGAAVAGKAISGSGKIIKMFDLGEGKYKVLVWTVKEGEVGSTMETVGTAKELGIKNIDELIRRGPGFSRHFLQDHVKE